MVQVNCGAGACMTCFVLLLVVLQDLIDKIAQLNSSIDEVAAQLKSKDTEPATLS
jgi:ferredoxin